MTFLDTSDLKNEEIALRLDHTFPGDPARNWVPAYYFDILDDTGQKVGFAICESATTRGFTTAGISAMP